MSDHIYDNPFETECKPDTPLDWFLKRMKASGITKGVADKCKITFCIGEDTPYFTIPYFDYRGIQTTLVRRRNQYAVGEIGPVQSGGGGKGKYSQPKNSRNQIYWPPVSDQTKEYNNPIYPLLICEGELKAIAAKRHLLSLGEGPVALVCGIPGTGVKDYVFDELRKVPIEGEDSKRRIIYIAIDWNARGQSRERAEQLEFQTRKVCEEMGAVVVILRWEIEEGAGEQKLDDWLVAGGDLVDAMNSSTETRKRTESELQELWDYFNTHYAIKDGEYIPLKNMTRRYSSRQFQNMEPSRCYRRPNEKKILRAEEVWWLQPPDDRNVVDDYIFIPAPLGQDPERYIHENGRRLLNTAPPAHWHDLPFRTETPDVTPFLNHIDRLCQEHSPWFLDFLAHCAQCPHERGHHIIIFKDDGNTGKSRLFDILDLVFGKYSGPIGTSLTGNFNSGLEHLVIAWWSDPVIHGGANRDLESALKNFSGDSKLSINHKFGAEYTVKGYGRLIIGTNKDWIVPVSTKERRFTVFGGLQPLHHADARALMDWMNSGGTEAVQQFLVDRDISSFDVYAPGPKTDQRHEMERVSATPLERMLNCEPFTDRDVWSTEQISREYNEQHGRKLSNDAIGRELSKLGVIKRLVKVGGAPLRLNAIRNQERWGNALPAEWAIEYVGPKH